MKKRKSLRIAIIDADYASNLEWDEYIAHPSIEITNHLVKSGHKVKILTANPKNERNERKPLYSVKNLHVTYLGIPTRINWIKRLSFFIALPFVTRKLQEDIILEYFPDKISLQFTPVFTRVPVIGIPKIFSSETPEKGIAAVLYPFEQLRTRMYHNVIAYTKDIATYIRDSNPKCRVEFIPFGIGKEYLTLKKQKPEYILFLGNMNIRKKGLDLLLYAYAKVSKKITYPLVIAGHGSDEAKIRLLVKKLHLEKKVHLVGPTYGDKKLMLLAKALLLAYPARFDDVPVVAIEAVAAGLPILSFDIPELSWTEESFSLKALPFDIADYARLLNYAAKETSLVAMEGNARRYAKKFSREKVAKAYEDLFLEVIEADNK